VIKDNLLQKIAEECRLSNESYNSSKNLKKYTVL